MERQEGLLQGMVYKLKEHSRRGKTRNLWENWSYQGNILPKDGHNKGQKLYGPNEADIKKRWQDYTEELYKKDFNEPDYYDGVVSHPESDILESKVK